MKHRLAGMLAAALLFAGCYGTVDMNRVARAAHSWDGSDAEESVSPAVRQTTTRVTEILTEYDRLVAAQRGGNPSDVLNRYFEIVRTSRALGGDNAAQAACRFAPSVNERLRQWNRSHAFNREARYESYGSLAFDEDVLTICGPYLTVTRQSEQQTAEHQIEEFVDRPSTSSTTSYQLCWRDNEVVPCETVMSQIGRLRTYCERNPHVPFCRTHRVLDPRDEICQRAGGLLVRCRP